MKNQAGKFSVYLASTAIKVLFFYLLARLFSQSDFVEVNSYFYYSDLALNLVSAGTVAFLTLNDDRLKINVGRILFFETTLGLMLFVISAIAFKTGLLKQTVSLSLLFALSLMRAINQIFTRHFMFSGKYYRSIATDILGNYVWICPFAILSLTKTVSVELALWMWFLALLAINFWNLIGERRSIREGLQALHFRKMWKIYFNVFHFTLLNKTYGSLEKIILIQKFPHAATMSGYVMASKVVGLGGEVTGGFIQSLMVSKVNSLGKVESETERFILRNMLAIILCFILVGAGILVFKPLILTVFKTQLSEENFSYMFWILPFMICNHLFSFLSVLLQRFHRYRVLQVSGVIQIATLGLIYLVDVGLKRVLMIETAVFALIIGYTLLQRKKLFRVDT